MVSAQDEVHRVQVMGQFITPTRFYDIKRVPMRGKTAETLIIDGHVVSKNPSLKRPEMRTTILSTVGLIANS